MSAPALAVHCLRDVVRLASRALAAVALCGSLVACGTVQSYRYPIDTPAAAVGSPPAIFFEGTLPGTGMRELAIVEALGTGNRANTADVITAMQNDATRFGASAIVRVRVDCSYGQCHGIGVAVAYVSAK